MKKIFLSLLVLCSSTMMAEEIPLSEAQTIAQKFLLEKGMTGFSKPKLAHKAVRSTKNKATQQSAYYVFNSDKQGYVVVAGDDRCAEILGYSTEGRFDIATAPSHVRAFLQGYADELSALDAVQTQPLAKVAPRRAVKALWSETARKSIAPMLKSKWDQTTPYNTYAPVFKDGSKAVTGCVATMLAQLMYFHQYPAATVGATETYTNQVDQLQVPGYPTNTAIDWANMRPTYTSGTYSTEQGNAVGHLMQICGSAVQMNYKKGESSAFLNRAADALRRVFGYDDGTRYVKRSNYTAQSWNDLVYNELREGRIVGVGGSSSGGGHAFIIDGYDVDGLFHVNWGWSGGSNGYFRLSILAPGGGAGTGASTSNDGYAIDQDLIVGIQKDNGQAFVPKEAAYSEVVIAANNTWKVNLGNAGEAPTRITFGYAFHEVGATPNLSTIRTLTASNLGLNNMLVATSNYLQKHPSMVIGKTYQLVFYYKTASVTAWTPTVLKNTDVIYATLDNAGNVVYTPTKKLISVSDDAMSQTFVSGNRATINYRFSNTSEVDYIKMVQLVMDNNGQLTLLATSGVSVAAGKTEMVPFSFTMPNTSNVRLKLIEENVPSSAFYEHTITAAAAPQIDLTPGNLKVTNVKNSVTYDRSLAGTYELTNNLSTASKAQVKVDLLKHSHGSYYTYFRTVMQEVELGGNESKTVNFDLGDNEPSQYFVIVTAGGKKVQGYPFTLKKGVVVYDEKGVLKNTEANGAFTVPANATFVDLSGTNVTSIVANANPNTIYMLSASQAVLKTQLVGKNVVIDGRAERIQIENKYPYFSPVEYKAAEITYRHSVGEGAKTRTDGWEGLILPFVPMEVKIAETQEVISWRKQRSDEGRFWLKEYIGATDNQLYFEHVQQFEANMPYLVAFPGDFYGEDFSLANKHVLFTATDATVQATREGKVATSAYRFRASTAALTSENAYRVNTAGTQFVYTPQFAGHGFNALFELRDPNVNTYAPVLFISDATLTGIEKAATTDNATGIKVYDMNGQLRGTTSKVNGVFDLSAFPRGVYIIGGKKVVK